MTTFCRCASIVFSVLKCSALVVLFSPDARAAVPDGNCSTSIAGDPVKTWSFPAQKNTILRAYWRARVSGLTDGVMMLGPAAIRSFSDSSIAARFGASGYIEALDGSATNYRRVNDLLYKANTTYEFNAQIDLHARRYSLTVTPPGTSAPVVIADNFAFRSSQTSSVLSHYGLVDDWSQGNVTICNFAVDKDRFGITQLHRAIIGGRQVTGQFDTGGYRKLTNRMREGDLEVRGDGVVEIHGATPADPQLAGVAVMTGAEPRMYFYDPLKNKWKNVEVTFYGMRTGLDQKVSSAGFVAGARTEHQAVNETDTNTFCSGRGYFGRLLYDSRVNFQKEVVHHQAYTVNKPSESSRVSWGTTDGRLPAGVWIGFKYIVRNIGSGVNLQVWYDLTNGVNGGSWVKLAEYTDTGSWGQLASPYDVQGACGYESNRVLTEAGTSVYIRNSGITGTAQARYSRLSIREIEP